MSCRSCCNRTRLRFEHHGEYRVIAMRMCSMSEENEFLINVVFTREVQTPAFKAAGAVSAPNVTPALGGRRVAY